MEEEEVEEEVVEEEVVEEEVVEERLDHHHLSPTRRQYFTTVLMVGCDGGVVIIELLWLWQ